ncbi:hypothetical protein KKD49_00815, partial [Myxococcota bacterium]|nr:hypothetical protein [Myxococcota bacterium]
MKSVWIFLVVMIVACTSAKVQDYCGDGVVGEHEECEISDTKPCENNSKLVTCSRYCTWNYSNCSDNCGDGIIQEQDGEECDGSELGETTCATLGYSRGLPACGSDCKFDTSTCEDAGSCGDGIFQPDWEECDSVLPVECADLGYFTGTATCNEDCTVDNSACNHVYQWGCSSSNILFSNTVDSEGNLIVVGITQCGFD